MILPEPAQEATHLMLVQVFRNLVDLAETEGVVRFSSDTF